MSQLQMTLTVLATQLSEALSKDAKLDGYPWNEEAGNFGPNVAEWLSDVASNVVSATVPTPSSGPCAHTFDFQATVYWNDETKRLPGSDAVNRMYGDRYFCTKCLFSKITNERPLGNSYTKPKEGTLPR